MSKPIFYQAVLVPINGNVLDHVYPNLAGTPNQMTLTERMGSEDAECPECGENSWVLLPSESAPVREGGKPYCECMNCGGQTHL